MQLLGVLLCFLVLMGLKASEDCENFCNIDSKGLKKDIACLNDCLTSRELQDDTEMPVTREPTRNPTNKPTEFPTDNPTVNPTISPTLSPTQSPTFAEELAFYEEYLYYISGGGGACLLISLLLCFFATRKAVRIREESRFKLDELKPIKVPEYLPENTNFPDVENQGFRSPQRSALVRMGVTSVPEKFKRAKDAMKFWTSEKTVETQTIDETEAEIEIVNVDEVEASFRAPEPSATSSGIWGRISSKFNRPINSGNAEKRQRRKKKKKRVTSLGQFELSKSKKNQIDYTLQPVAVRPTSNFTIKSDEF